MNILILLCFMSLINEDTYSISGESTFNKEFTIREKPAKIAKWLADHPKEIATATGSEIVSQDGNKVRVKQDTPKGVIEFTVVETIKEDGNSFDYSSVLVEVHKGVLEDQTTRVKITSLGEGSLIQMQLYAKVKNTKPIAIKISLAKEARSFQDLVEGEFGIDIKYYGKKRFWSKVR